MLVLQMVEALVDDVDSVELRTEELNDSICFRVQVSPSDIGKLIGKQGKRVIFPSGAWANGVRCFG